MTRLTDLSIPIANKVSRSNTKRRLTQLGDPLEGTGQYRRTCAGVIDSQDRRPSAYLDL